MAAETHNSLRALLGGTVRVEGEALSVSGAWIDPEEWRLRYVGLDVGGWLDRHVALVPAERLAWAPAEPGDHGADDRSVGGWRADVARAEVEADEARLAASTGPFDLAALPPILTGPFGNTISPLLMIGGYLAESEDEAPPRPPGGPEPDAPRDRVRALSRAGEWLDAPIAARHDVAGRGAEDGPAIDDLLIDPETLRVTHAVIEAGGRPRAVPVAHLRAPAEGERAVPVALTRAEIEAMPEVVGPRRTGSEAAGPSGAAG